MEAPLRKVKEYYDKFVRAYWLKDAIVIGTTLGVFLLISFFYLWLKPTVVIPPPSVIAKCPARWSYNVDTQECEPQYSTQCLAFNPDKINDTDKCDIVKVCGTYWKGLCNYS